MQKLLTALLVTALSHYASAQQLELINGNVPTGNGPTLTPPAATFRLSTGATNTAFAPTISATVTFTNQAFTSAATDGIIAGGTIDGSTANAVAGTTLYPALNSLGAPTNSQYSADPYTNPGTGIDVANNAALRLLTDATYLQGQSLSGRYYYGNIVITFSRPVHNPVLHFSGIGGNTYTAVNSAGDPTNSLGFYTEFDLPTGVGYSFTELSGSSKFNVTSTQILNSSTAPSSVPAGAADGAPYTTQSGNAGGGSVRVNTNGTAISSITLRVYLRGDGGIGSGNSWAAPVTDPRTGDAYNLSISLPTYSLSGNVYNDINGLTDNLVNQSGATNPLPTLYANLISSNGTLFKSTLVTGGTYSFPNVLTDNYTVVLATTATATTNSLPADWVNTGEKLGTGTGSDGTVNGQLAAAVSSTTPAVTNANFGIQQPPIAGGGVVNGILNPGGTQQYTVTQANWTNTAATTDPTPGAVTFIRITGFPTGATSMVVNGTPYTASSTVWTTGGIVVPVNTSGQPTQTITVDPTASGVTQVSIPFRARDAAGAESSNTGAAVINFIDLTISGMAHLDANGGIIDGPGIGQAAPTGSTTNQQLYVNLISSGGAVLASRPLPTSGGTTGTYLFGNADGVEANTNYTVVLSTTTSATSTLPGGWVRMAEGVGGTTGDGSPNGIQSVAVATTSVVNRDFAIERGPQSDNKSQVLNPSPAQGQLYTLNGGANPPFLTGSDPEDQPTSGTLSGKRVHITSLPTNGQLFYNNAQITVGQNGTSVPTSANPFVIPSFNPSLLQWKAVGGNYTSTTFTYAYVDAAGVVDASPATYTLSWNIPLAVELLRFDATATGCDVKLGWEVASAQNVSRYDVQFSRTGEARDFATVVSAEAGKSAYEAFYTQPQGEGFYRLRITEASGDVSFSRVRSVHTSCGTAVAISLFPNPTQGLVTVEGLQAGSVLRLLDLHGKVVISTTATGTTSTLDLGALAAGTYQLIVVADDAAAPHSFKVVKQ